MPNHLSKNKLHWTKILGPQFINACPEAIDYCKKFNSPEEVYDDIFSKKEKHRPPLNIKLTWLEWLVYELINSKKGLIPKDITEESLYAATTHTGVRCNSACTKKRKAAIKKLIPRTIFNKKVRAAAYRVFYKKQ